MRVLKRPPHFLLESPCDLRVGVGRIRRVFIFEEPLAVLALAILVLLKAAVADDVRHNAKERQFLVERHHAGVLREVELSSAVVVEDVAEDVGIAVEEVLPDVLVEEEVFLV